MLTTKESRKNRRGQSIETPYSDIEALALLESVPGEFAQDLVRKSQKFSLSDEQYWWVHKLVLDHKGAARELKERTVHIEPHVFDELAAVFTHAADRLKYPRIRLPIGEGRGVVLKLGKDRDRIRVLALENDTSGERLYYGTLHAGGRFVKPSGHCTPDDVMDLLNRLGTPQIDGQAVSVTEFIAHHGKLFGCCCFCRQSLTDKRSLSAGYGPICAENWGLPWG